MTPNIENIHNGRGVLSAGNAPCHRYAIVLAGGEGHRAGGEVPKQFQSLNGLPVLWWSVKAFHQENPDTHIILVIHPGYFDLWDTIAESLPEEEKALKFELCCGGRSRLESVKNGLMMVTEDDALLAVHDAARPLLTPAMISAGWECAGEKGAAVPAVPMSDSLRRLTPDGSVAVLRKDYVTVQTPQVFRSGIIKEAYGRPMSPDFTDDASVVEAAGVKVSLYPGEPTNIKITHPLDIVIASDIMDALGK